MNEVEFKNWSTEQGKNRKVIIDTISRLKRIERECDHCDLDEEYRNDRCSKLLSAFLNKGLNDDMASYNTTSLPIGKYYMSTYRYALKQYVAFCDETATSSKK